MKKKLIAALSLALCGTFALGLSACKDEAEVHDDIVNGGFEQGFTGWTKSGTAFSQGGVVDTNVAGVLKEEAGKAGKFFFSGYDSGNPQFTGTLQSDPFVLGGTGKIGFLMGGGMSGDKCYVEFFEQGNDTALAKVSNEAFALGYITDQMVRVVVDLSAHVGKTIYIKVTDNDKGDADEYAYLNLDDFVVYKTAEDVTKAEKERTDKLAAIGKPAFSETETDTAIKNGGFEEGLVNWLMLDGNAFGARALCSDEMFWANPEAGASPTTNRPYNKEGKNFLSTYFNEDAQGSIRSTKFTLAGDGIISFLMAGSPSDKNYVALCDSEGKELKTVTFAAFADPALSENMVRHYIDAHEYIGKVLYLKVVDKAPTGTGFRGIVVDDFKVSMVEADVKAQMKADYRKAQEARANEPVSVSAAEYNYYNTKCAYPYTLEALRFTKEPTGGIVAIGETVDLSDYLADASATYTGTDTVAIEIVSITFGTTVTTTGLNAFTFEEEGTYTVTYRATKDGDTLEGTFTLVASNTMKVANGDFETGDLTGWTVVEGADKVNVKTAVSSDEYGWTGAPYNQGGSYHFDGAAAASEGDTFTLRSSDFVLSGAGIISFKLGGRGGKLSVYEKESGICLASFTNTQWNDDNNPHAEQGCRNLTMTTYYYDLSDYLGATLYIEVADTETSNWGIVHFDEVETYYPAGTEIADFADKKDTVTYTCEGGENTFEIPWVLAENTVTPNRLQITEKAAEYVEVTATEAATLNVTDYLENVKGAVIGEADPDIQKAITKIVCGENETTEDFGSYQFEVSKTYVITYRLSYTDKDGQEHTAEASFTLVVIPDGQIHNGGFEYGDMTGWTTEKEGFKTDTAVLGAATYWGEGLPYNQSGNYHLDGFDVNSGIGETDTWSVKSETFVLGGAGIITVKMGGRAAAVRVYKVEGDTETLIGYYKQNRNIDPAGAFPNVANGSWADMATYVIDLSTHLGETLRIELCDEEVEGGWANAFFDEVITYYAAGTQKSTLLANKDTVNNSNGQTPETVDIPWIEATNSLPEAPAEDAE